MKKFKCRECGYIHIGDEAPMVCPVCAYESDVFFEMKNDNLVDDNNFFEMIEITESSTLKIIRNLFDSYSELSIISLAMAIQAKHESKLDYIEKFENLSRELSNQAAVYVMFLGEFLEFNTESNAVDLKKKIAKLMSKNNELNGILPDDYNDYKEKILKNNKALEALVVKM